MSIASVEAQNDPSLKGEQAKQMTPELLWKLGRLSPMGISMDGKSIVYKVTFPSVAENKSDSKYYFIPVSGGIATEISDYKALLKDKNISPDGKHVLYSEEVKIDKGVKVVFSSEIQDESSLKITDGKNFKKSFYGTNSYMPGLFGLYAAETVIRYLLDRVISE